MTNLTMKQRALAALETFRALDHQMAAPSTDPAKLAELAKERKRMEPIVEASKEYIRLADDMTAVKEMLVGGDEAMAAMARDEQKTLVPRLEASEKSLHELLAPRDPMYDRTAIIEIRAAAGGDEAGLFAGELFRMYTRFAQEKGLNVQVFSSSQNGVGGLKEVTFSVSGDNAYGWFRFEQGGHRVQRVPETEAQGRVHTSTVTVAVLAEPTEVEVKVDMKDLRIDTYRASGAGGQHVNKTESAIRITHIPSGVVVACQDERSQGQNRLRAMSLLRAKLQEDAEQKQLRDQKTQRKKQIGTGDRSEKIRTYNFPQDRITDHRINFSLHNIEGFMSGDIGEMIKALEARAKEIETADLPAS